MIFPQRSLAGAALAVCVLASSGCGPQADDRVPPPPASEAGGQATPAATDSSATASTPVQSQAAAATPYVTLDCATLEGVGVDAPPADAANVGDAWALFPPSGAPSLTLATDAQPATELGVADIAVGEGPEVRPGDTITVDYCGAGFGGRAVFDSSWARGEPATFPLQGLIPGWQEGIPGMKAGGKRLLVIPGELGYGPTGTQGIAPDETLVFVIQLQAIG